VDWEFPVGVQASVRSSGLFAFWQRENFQAPVLKSFAKPVPPSAAEKLAPQYRKRPVFLIRPQDVHPNRPRYQIGQLQAGRIDFLVGEYDVKWQGYA